MKLIMDIDKNDYEYMKNGYVPHSFNMFYTIKNGTPIPDNATNGDVIKTMFGVKEVDMENTYCVHFPEEEDYSHYFFKDWWNSPYQKGGK